MAKKIFKYENIVGSISYTPHLNGGRVVHVAEAPRRMCDALNFWIEFTEDEDATREESAPRRKFVAWGTGQPVPDNYSYCGTAVCKGGTYVWHLYEACS